MSEVLLAISTTLLVLVGYVLTKGYRHRSHTHHLRRLGLPMPEWSWVTGSLVSFRQYLKRFPPDIFISVMNVEMCKDFTETDMFYQDLWPLGPTFLIVNDPLVAMHVTSSKQTFPKPSMYKHLFDPITGGPSLLTTNGQEWKEWRSIFNPAFAHSYLLEQISAVVGSTEIFCGKLRERANRVFPLDEIATRLTMDIIFKVAIDDDLNYQNASNPMADSLRSILSWCNFGNPFLQLHPIRPLAIWYYGRTMDKYVRRALNARFEELKREVVQEESKHLSKSVVALALRDYIQKQGSTVSSNTKLDENFATVATRQMRLFMFGGHHTTASVLVYTYHMLSRYPDILRRVQNEHQDVLGPNPSDAGRILKSNASLLNQLPYTLAVIKETMRMYPPAGCFRAGLPGVSLVDRNGMQYPTDGCTIAVQHNALHLHPRYWKRPNEFLPERWLVDVDHELYPTNGAFRVFEQGPRSCIGQNLSLIELRVVLAMTIRSFKIEPAYEEWDEVRPMLWSERLGFSKEEVRSIDGDRAYQVEKGVVYPAQGYPCRVTSI